MTTTVPAVPISPQLADQLRQIAEAHREATAARDYAICKAATNGGSLREIAELVGLSHSGVKRIISRQDPDWLYGEVGRIVRGAE